jgi:diacylglycerol kinase family enzyme
VRRIALLANLESGSGGAEDVPELLRRAGAEVEAFGFADTDAALASSPDVIAVAGGDGSIGSAAAAAAKAGLPLAVIAVGTANDFAGVAGLPDDPAAACELAASGGSHRRYELGRAGELPFVNVASVGLSPQAAEEAHGLKDRIGALAYPAGAVKAGATADPVTCEVECDGERIHAGEAWQVSVACTGAFGGGASLEADASDGKLDVVVIEGRSRARLVKHAYGLRVGSVEGQQGVIDARCGTVTVRLNPGECMNVDGEVIEARDLAADGRIGFRVDPDRFDLIVG